MAWDLAYSSEGPRQFTSVGSLRRGWSFRCCGNAYVHFWGAQVEVEGSMMLNTFTVLDTEKRELQVCGRSVRCGGSRYAPQKFWIQLHSPYLFSRTACNAVKSFSQLSCDREQQLVLLYQSRVTITVQIRHLLRKQNLSVFAWCRHTMRGPTSTYYTYTVGRGFRARS